MTDWKEVIASLADKGFTQQEIADYVGCSQSYVGQLSTGLRGKAVSFVVGSALLNMKAAAENGEVLPRRIVG